MKSSELVILLVLGLVAWYLIFKRGSSISATRAVTGVNPTDPFAAQQSAQLNRLEAAVIDLAGGLGKVAGQGVASAAVNTGSGLVRGAASAPLTNEEIASGVTGAYRSGSGAGGVVGSGGAAVVGGFAGGGIVSGINSFRDQTVYAADAAKTGPAAQKYGTYFDPNNIGDSIGAAIGGWFSTLGANANAAINLQPKVG